MQGRLQPDYLTRVERFCDRCVAVAERLEKEGRFRRIVEQLACSSSSFGANTAEASEAMSRKDFRKCLAIAAKELAETRFWLRLAVLRAWVTPEQVGPLNAELEELRKITGSILFKTRPQSTRKPAVKSAL